VISVCRCFIRCNVMWYLLTVFDATGKLPPGVAKGSLVWLGNYKECISTELIPGVNDTRRGVSSHYCPVAIELQPMVCIANEHRLYSCCYFGYSVLLY